MKNPNSKIPSRWQLLAVDLDGTLIGWNHKINDRDLGALRRAREAGVHVAICTGRNAIESAGIISALQLPEPHGLGVFVNGAMICDTADGRCKHSTFMGDGLAEELIDFFGGHGHAVLILADDPVTRLPAYCRTDHGPPHEGTVKWLERNRIHAHVGDPPGHLRGRILRVGTVVNTDEAPLLVEGLERFHSRAATHSIYSPHYDCQVIEAFELSVNKWTGLRHLARLMGLDERRIIAIGDDINDVAMLRNAALSFAMGNAAANVQGQAKRVTGRQEDCGVAQVVEQLLAGRLENMEVAI